jgi:hypothetical protein
MVGLIVVAACLIVAMVMMLWPYKVVEITDLMVSPATVRTGDTMTATFSVKKFTDDVAVTNWSLQDGANYVLASGSSSSQPGEFITSKAILLNIDVPPGRYHLVLSASYNVNPLRTLHYRWVCENQIVVVR